jgi:hypothetical protein
MTRRSRFSLLAGLLIVCAIGALIALAYAAGAASDGATHDFASGSCHCLGAIFAFFLVVLAVGLVCRVHRCYAQGPWDQPSPGGGGWHRRDAWIEECRASAKSALDEWHRAAHAEKTPSAGEPPEAADDRPASKPLS